MDGGPELNQNINLAGEAKKENISDKVIFEWSAPNFSKSDKTTRWYLIASVIIIAIIGYSAWQRDWFVIGITIVVSAILFWYVHSVTPHDVSYRLTPMGIYTDDRFYPFSEMHSFWMVYNQNVKNLYVALQKKYLPTLVLSLEDIDPVILKGYLVKKIPEQEDRGESTVDKISRIIGI
ncbi:MAG: hypothetical protein PHW75_01500 [Patescibacteria group bacterium]|nr:hypothetical protein [Patescibacteria group bacterium]